MKTLAEFKRSLTPGQSIILKERFGKEVNAKREVAKVQTNAIAFKLDNGKLSWLTWPKASLIEFDGQYIKIYGKGKRPLTEAEKLIKEGYEKIRNKRQEEIDLLSDGSTSYYQEIAYYKKHNALYLMGHETERGLRYDFNSGLVWDDDIKGNIELIYELI